MHSQQQRQLSPYEQTHLRRHGVNPERVLEFGEMPVEYITGKVVFCEHEFDISPHALIPRVETEELVHRAKIWCQKQKTKTPLLIADVGTGSGAAAICLSFDLQQLGIPHHVWASDISAEALQVAKKNATRILKDSARFTIIQSDLLKEFPSKKFDLMLANLPYIPTARIPHLESSVKDFEPIVALDGGPDGLQLIRPFLQQAADYLKVGGTIMLEVDYTHDERAFDEFRNQYQIHTDIDQFLRQRFVTLQLKMLK